jgi:type III pantothenate kinase
MRRLLLDLGNTRLKWRLLEQDRLQGEGALAHGRDDFDAALASLLDEAGTVRVWLASVTAPALTARVEARLAALPSGSVQRVRVTPGVGRLRLAYADPSRLGVDRWLAMLGADRDGSAPCVVVLAGTALTLDAITGDGQHLGGLIAPGLGLQRQVLTAGPLHLADATGLPTVLFADSTEAAVASGPAQALAALIERFADAVCERCGQAPGILLAGGDGARLRDLLSRPAQLRPQLVLDGLLAFSGADRRSR